MFPPAPAHFYLSMTSYHFEKKRQKKKRVERTQQDIRNPPMSLRGKTISFEKCWLLFSQISYCPREYRKLFSSVYFRQVHFNPIKRSKESKVNINLQICMDEGIFIEKLSQFSNSRMTIKEKESFTEQESYFNKEFKSSKF